AAGPAREDVADHVDPHATPGFLTPADEEPARLPVEIARRQPAHPAFLGRADLRQFHQACPQPFAVDLQVPHPALPLAISSSRSWHQDPAYHAHRQKAQGGMSAGCTADEHYISPSVGLPRRPASTAAIWLIRARKTNAGAAERMPSAMLRVW